MVYHNYISRWSCRKCIESERQLSYYSELNDTTIMTGLQQTLHWIIEYMLVVVVTVCVY